MNNIYINRAKKRGFKCPQTSYLYGSNDVVVAPDDNNAESKSILKLIYAPDPRTGLPDSSLPLKLMNTNSDGVRRVINNFVLKPLPHQSSRQDADAALSLTPSRSEQYGNERNRYIAQLRDAVREGIKEYQTMQAESEENV